MEIKTKKPKPKMYTKRKHNEKSKCKKESKLKGRWFFLFSYFVKFETRFSRKNLFSKWIFDTDLQSGIENDNFARRLNPWFTIDLHWNIRMRMDFYVTALWGWERESVCERDFYKLAHFKWLLTVTRLVYALVRFAWPIEDQIGFDLNAPHQ